MLPYALAVTVGLSSSVLFVTAFLFRDIHRQDDFFWSGVGLFYALVLWFCATSITGAVLLGQLAVVALLTAYFWQVIKLRKAIAHPEQQNNLDSFSVVSFFKNLFKRSPVATVEQTEKEPSTSETAATPQKSTPPITETNQTAKTKTSSEKENQTKVVDESANRDRQLDSFSKPTSSSATVQSNEITDTEDTTQNTSEISVETTVKEVTTEPEIQPSVTEATKLETTEIAIETVTVVEEETNWDDEIEDLPASSVKVIQEVPTPPENESQSSTTDTPSQEQKPNTKPEPLDNSESLD